MDLEIAPLFSPPEFQALTEIGDSRLIKSLNKHYLVMHDMEHRTTEEGGDSPLPVVLEETRDIVEIDVEIGDENRRKIVSVTLRITFDDSYSGWNKIRVDLNGNTLDMQSYGLRLIWQNPNANEKNPIRIEGIEFLVNYVNEQ